jgi:hypothetical protein
LNAAETIELMYFAAGGKRILQSRQLQGAIKPNAAITSATPKITLPKIERRWRAKAQNDLPRIMV